LSGGERQRVAIARALTRDPRVFLFDEPFSSLDAKLRTEARVELKKLLREFPVSSIYVTHDQHEAIAIAHRLAIMREGKIEQIGTYATLYDNPINIFVATFLGTPTINLFDGRIERGHWRGDNFGGCPVRGDLEDGSRVTVGIRPESIRLTEDGAATTVESVTPYFSERHVVVEVRAGRERWTLQLPFETAVPSVGETIRCALDDDALLFFDTVSGRRIG
jgi:multiple sugar transport system ATP-binding protein